MKSYKKDDARFEAGEQRTVIDHRHRQVCSLWLLQIKVSYNLYVKSMYQLWGPVQRRDLQPL